MAAMTGGTLQTSRGKLNASRLLAADAKPLVDAVVLYVWRKMGPDGFN